MSDTAQEQRTKRDEWWRIINTSLLSVLVIIISVASTMIIDSNKRLNEKIDGLMIQVAVNAANQVGHDVESAIWEKLIETNVVKIDALELGNVKATMDRFTKTEAMDAMDAQRKWVEKYFERKE